MQDSLDLLEWPTLYGHLQKQCLTPYGLNHWATETFLEKADAIEKHQAEVDALKVLLVRYGEPILDAGFPDITSIVRRLAKEGLLNLEEMRQVMRTLKTGRQLFRHFRKGLEKEHHLDILEPLLSEDVIPVDVIEYLGKYLDDGGDLKDTASARLGSLRQRLRQQRQSVQQKLNSYFHNPDYVSMFQGNNATDREGRFVLPVKVEYKNKLPGVIHGASASGSTVFLEPQGLVEMNNQLQALQSDLQKEIERILKEISQHLHTEWEVLESFIHALGRLDKRYAAARLSKQIEANPVEIFREEALVDLKQARHPLLLLNRLREEYRLVVANDIHLGLDGIRTLVITGPNTGGKTVLLKTVGLFALMLRAGLHLPVAENSRMALFKPVLADIGDQQSIAQNLSTFSAHMARLRSFLSEETDLSRGLVLIDEIAAGTDPAEGAALAKAILDSLYQKGGLTMVTTHLGELKIDAHQHEGFMNASVEFDTETLSPTYRLLLGVPGSSNAITIAQKLGLNESVINKAKAALSAPVRESSALIEELEAKNRQVEEELQKARAFRLSAQESFEKVEWERQKLEDEKRQSLKQFQTSLKSRIHDLEAQVKEMRKELQQGEVQNLDKLSGRLSKAGQRADHIFSETRDDISQLPGLTVDELKVGDTVYSKQLEVTGDILSISRESEEVTLQAGLLRITVPVADLQKPYTAKGRKRNLPSKAPTGGSKGTVVTQEKEIALTCDVRGKRQDEAMAEVEKFLDDALVAGFETVGIVHGVGTGALKKAIRQYLSSADYVKRFYPAEARLGGDGKTIVEL